jgi:hypothetical protein
MRTSDLVFTYLIRQGGHGGPFKVGKTTDIKRRMAELQTASPYPLYLVDIMVGDHENFLHGELDYLRLEGEWFDGSNPRDVFYGFEGAREPTEQTSRDCDRRMTEARRVKAMAALINPAAEIGDVLDVEPGPV